MSTPHQSSESDPVRPWFEALEAVGEFIGIRFGRVPREGGEVEWMYLDHTEYDGIGGMAHLLRERGAPIGELPKITHPGALSWWTFLRFLPVMLAPRKILKWRELKQGDEPADAAKASPAVAFHVFDEEKTARIRLASRLCDVTVNSLLMKYLDRAVRPSLDDPARALPWMVPVNLRGQVTRERDTGNHSSYVPIRIFASEGVKEVQQRIYRALQKGQHLAVWMGFAASRKTSMETKKRLIRESRATAQWSVGGFSNLGEWDADKEITAPECQGDWLFAPPVLRFQMVGAGCVTFQRRLTLTLQIHPELTTSPEVAADWMRSWVREIELGLPDGCAP
jgi:hypothetical protein